MTDDLRIYNIDQKIDDAAAALTVDEETGEIVGGAEFEKLLQQSADKVLNCARYLAVRENALEAMKAHYKNTSIRIQQEEKRKKLEKISLQSNVNKVKRTASRNNSKMLIDLNNIS